MSNASEPKPMPNYWAMAEEVTHLHGQLDQLQAENAKLREYVNAMAIQSYKGEMFDCGYCPFVSQCYNDEPKEHQGRGCQWWLWARELGIEAES